ncbi:MAG: LamG domain-containing protein, partial [Pirellulales bacterium]|nr:LamG domain-containing protein [Pirellulales bacterium]
IGVILERTHEMKAREFLSVLAIIMMATSANAGLRAYWAFDEGSGDATADLSGNGNTGMLVAETEAGDPPTALPGTTLPAWTSGVSGGALLFGSPNGSNYNSVHVAKSDSLKDLGSTWSFALWIRQDSNATSPGGGAGYQRLISCPNYELELGVPGWQYDYFWPYNPVNAAFQVDIGSSYIGRGGSLGEWYHMAVTYDGTELKKYLNGELVLDSVKNIPNQLIHNNWDDTGWTEAVLKLGNQTWPNKDFFMGAMDDVAIWGDQYLTAAQVAGLHQGQYTPLTIPEPGSVVLFGLSGLVCLLFRKYKEMRCVIPIEERF